MANNQKIDITWKYIWMSIVIVLFLILIFVLIGNVSRSLDTEKNYAELTKQCNQNMDDLYNQWQNAYDTLNDCYKKGLSGCYTIIPKLD